MDMAYGAQEIAGYWFIILFGIALLHDLIALPFKARFRGDRK